MAEKDEREVDTVGRKASAKGTQMAKVTFSEVASSVDAVFCWLWTQSPIVSLIRCSLVLLHQESTRLSVLQIQVRIKHL